jgi:hypothetical protein
MANVKINNVIRIDTDNAVYAGPLKICGIKWKARGSTPSAQILADQNSSGTVLWESAIAADTEVFEDVSINCPGGIHVDIAGTNSILYLYLE